ncbi:YdcF family protein [Auraticoccus monumenti]|uniref:DUF218 domain-containing protein n=1 Tax=Auraticoccus monumenti TaxID=675864 RepID=A0A1G6RGA9_9ACTN|nr:ElyC/SanA/YdcF family protein [Auraticoccus monumenti]SDD03423.1 DUF218 domain-containing protein [Auraticoccus monumenti]
MATITEVPRRVTRPLAVFVTLLAVWVSTGVVLLGLPRLDDPRRVDALLVLGPADGRLPQAAQLMQDGLAGTLVLSLPAPTAASPATSSACGAEHPYPVICFAADPVTTQGEAQAFAQLAEEHGWRSMAVLTHRSHLGRAGILIRRCFDGEVDQLGSQERYTLATWFTRWVYETGAWTKMALTPGCYDELPFRWSAP